MKKISASIVVYNEDKGTLGRVIESFLALPFQKELVVVDNSPQNLLEEFLDAYKDATYIFLNRNVGFGAGHNIAFHSLTQESDVHFVLNPDIFFSPAEMTLFLEWFGASQETVLAMPRVLYPDGSVQHVVRNIPTPLSLIKRKFIQDYDVIDVKENSIVEIPFAHGCFMAFKSDTYKKLGGFDERYFMYMEDVDIWIRAKRYGKTVLNTNYKIFHEHRKGSAKSFKLFLWHVISAFKFFVRKNCF